MGLSENFWEAIEQQPLPHEKDFRNIFYRLPDVAAENMMDFFRHIVQRGEFSQEDKDWILFILDHVAVPAHDEQYRREGPAYIIHPVEVEIEALLRGEGADVICTALLHDVREDTILRWVKESELEKMFGDERVLKLTRILSKVHGVKELSPEVYRKNVTSDKDAIRLKAYDIIVNLRSFGRGVFAEPARVCKQINEQKEDWIPLIEKAYPALVTEITLLVQKIELRLNEALKRIQEALDPLDEMVGSQSNGVCNIVEEVRRRGIGKMQDHGEHEGEKKVMEVVWWLEECLRRMREPVLCAA